MTESQQRQLDIPSGVSRRLKSMKMFASTGVVSLTCAQDCDTVAPMAKFVRDVELQSRAALTE